MTPAFGFVGPSGAGKTTLLAGVVRALVARGLRVGVVEHSRHDHAVDRAGSDTWRLRDAGAHRATLVTPGGRATFDAPATFESGFDDVDVVLVEGWRSAPIPRLVVRRAAADDPTWEAPPDALAWVTDLPVPGALPLDADAVATFLLARLAPPPVTMALAGTRAAPPLWDGPVLAVCEAPVADGLPEAIQVAPGPLGALVTALVASPTPRVLLAGPHARGPFSSLVAAWGDVVTAGDPLCAVYGPRCLEPAVAALRAGEALDAWWPAVRVTRLSG